MPTQAEQEQQAEQELQAQTAQKFAALKQEIGEKLDKFAEELTAHFKSTGQYKKQSEANKPQSSQDRTQEKK